MSLSEAKSKKEKRKEKKSSASVKEVVEPVDSTVDDVVSNNVVDDEEAMDSDKSAGKSSKNKRKRDDTETEELEINLALPEPPSRKALRAAKKQKSSGDLGADEIKLDVGDGKDAKTKSTRTPLPDESEKRGKWGIWIGNLPWSASKEEVRMFIATGAGLTEDSITRIHMPTPNFAKKVPGAPVVNKNKGYAYVDFDSEQSLNNAMLLTETEFSSGMRKVLIKNAKSFEGRPEKQADGTGAAAADGSGPAKVNTKPPSKRVFIGNLPFEITKDDLTYHYGKCGPIADIHMATFEDTGKCKGYAWITFEELEAAQNAVQGWVWTEPEDEDEDGSEASDDAGLDDEAKAKKREKRRRQNRKRWFVNRYLGRQLRAEFAEDAGVRYKKRFGKDAQANKAAAQQDSTKYGEVDDAGEGAGEKPKANGRSDRAARPKKEVNTKKLIYDVNLQKTQGAIVASEGKKTTFDD